VVRNLQKYVLFEQKLQEMNAFLVRLILKLAQMRGRLASSEWLIGEGWVNTGRWMPDARYWILDTRFWMLGAQFWMLDASLRSFDCTQ